MRLIHRIRCAIDEPYRIRTGFGLSPIRNKREEKALIDFCVEELKDTKHMNLNPDKRDVYKSTVVFYKDNGCIDHYFVNENCGWYWS